MSNPSALNSFLEQLRDRPELRQRLSAVAPASPQVMAETLVQLAGDEGVASSPDDWLALLSSASSEGEISDDALSEVSGGGTPNFFALLRDYLSPKVQHHED